MTTAAIELVYSYAHEDEALCDQLNDHLALLQHQGFIQSWHDRDISAGGLWAEEIDKHLETARIILLLVSSSFIASKYCYGIEMQKAMARHETGEAIVIPVILRPCDWEAAPFSKLQALPKNAKPITAWTNRDAAFTDVAKSIRKVIQAGKKHITRVSSQDDYTERRGTKRRGKVAKMEASTAPTEAVLSAVPEELSSAVLKKLVDRYHKELKMYEGRASTESALRLVFQNLLADAAHYVNWLLVAEQTIEDGIRPDGVLRDVNNLRRGYWEAKGPDSDLAKEIEHKIDKGYPLDNTIFENTKSAVLYQGKRKVLECSLQNTDDVIDLLKLFFNYTEPHIENFQAAIFEFKRRIPALVNDLLGIIEKEHERNSQFVAAFSNFAVICRTSLDPKLTDKAIDEMLVQHLLTERLFRTVFNNPDFVTRNVIAAEIEKVIQAMTIRTFRQELFKSLDRYYIAIESTAQGIESWTARQEFLNTVYEGFFQGVSAKQADTYGIVYTPQEIVNFMCDSVEEVLKREFGEKIATPGVKILDPSTGTGNYIVNLIRHYIPRGKDLVSKYQNDLFCNEIMLLPYYIASLNIEHEYFEKMKVYQSFPGICFADTLELAEDVHAHEGDLLRQSKLFMVEENTERVNREREAEITAVLGNPPYNVGQKRENDNSKNRPYPVVDRRVRETYAKDSMASNKNALSDVYVRFFRWATDRLENHDGIVCLVTNNSFIDQIAFDGMRKHLLKDFTRIYHLDLHGNVRKNPKLSGTTHNVFGIRVGVGITIAIRSSKHETRKIYYYRVPEYWRKAEKFAFLEEKKNIYTIDWLELQPDEKQTWITEGLHPEFATYLPIGSRDAKAASNAGVGGVEVKTIFKLYSQGVQTGRDEWMYDFNRGKLAAKASSMIETYRAELSRWIRAGCPEDIDGFVIPDESKIKWSSRLKECLKRKVETEFREQNIRNALYRPYSRRFLYFDNVMTHRQSLLPTIFPTPVSEAENKLIWLKVGTEWPMFALATNVIPDLLPQGGSQCFPYYTYAPDGTHRQENITDWALKQFQIYGSQVTKWDIFHYVYALLHHPQYRERYKENLKRDLPHIPLVKSSEGFWKFVDIGQQLMNLHIKYEEAEEYKDLRLIDDGSLPYDESRRVEKMRLSPDRKAVIVNKSVTLSGIPQECFAYQLGNRSALEWVIDQYQVTKDQRSGIMSDPNRSDDEEYIISLLKRVVTVSVQTMQLVHQLDQAASVEDWLEEVTTARATTVI